MGFEHRSGVLHCDDLPLDDLAARHGTPLYVYSQSMIQDRYRAFHGAFAPLDRLIAYSVKANGNLSVLRLLAAEGAGADIVSGGELHRALLAGIPGERIVFSGVGKTEPEMRAALEAGIRAFNVESEGELAVLAAVAEGMGLVAPVALRINPDIESPTPHRYTRTGHRQTKFGIPSEDAVRLYQEAASRPGLEPVGIDAHIGSQILEPEPYRRALLHLMDLVGELAEQGIALRHVDLGGGFGVDYDGDHDPDTRVFAELVTPHLATSDLTLVLEPGRAIVGHAGVLLTRVLFVKEMGGKTFVITDAGMNDLLRPSHYEAFHRVEHVGGTDGRPTAKVDVVGPVCETGDFLALDREMPRPERGDLLAVRTVGAYGMSMASNYNARPRAAEVLVNGDEATVIRRREAMDDLIRGEN